MKRRATTVDKTEFLMYIVKYLMIMAILLQTSLWAISCRLISTLVIMFSFNLAKSQEWQHVVELIPIPGRPLTISQLETFENNSDYLFFSGMFMGIVNNNDTVYLHSIGKWDGETFSSISGVALTVQEVGENFPINSIKIINDTIYLRRSNQSFETPIVENQLSPSILAKLTSNGWQDLNSSFDLSSSFFLLNNEIFVFERNLNATSLEYEIINENSINSGDYNSSSFEVFQNFSGGIVIAACYWNGYTYLAGNFDSPSDILRFSENGESDFLGNQLSVGGYVSAFAVYQDYLVVGGAFTVTDQQGNTIHNIAKWDGDQWHPVFGLGVNAAVSKLKIFNDVLYVTGSFSYVFFENEWYPASKIVAFNGEDVYRISDEIFHGGGSIHDVAVFQNSLYVSGNFISIQNKPITAIARLDTPVSLFTPELFSNQTMQHLKCYPNPTNGFTRLFIQNEDLKGTIELIDSKGRTIKQVTVLNLSEYNLPLYDIDSGFYFIRYLNEKQIQTIKIIVN